MDMRESGRTEVSSLMERILYEVKKVVVGQDHFLERVLVAILAQGHLLVEGVDEVEVGYGFYPEFWGRGLATEIATACLAFARSQLELRSVVAITLPANVRSQRVMTKVGLVYERDISHEELRHLLFRSRPAAG